MRRTGLVMLAVIALGCRSEPEPEDLLDTGWFEDTADFDPETCPHTFDTVLPEEGEDAWYWRTDPVLYTHTDKQDWYDARLLTAGGELVSDELAWAETGVSFTLPTEPLQADTSYTIEYTDCQGLHAHDFATSHLGLPLEDGPSALVKRTWAVDLVGATWVEPGGFSAVMQLYFNVPVLIGVQYADDSLIDLIGGPGYIDSDGDLFQNTTQPTWEFPVADFSEQPYLEATTDQVTFDYQGTAIPVYDFRFTTTISADGTTLGGGVVSGVGDTRNMGPLLESGDDPSAVCDFAAGVGVTCEPCPNDQEPYCLYLQAVNVEGTEVPDLVLTPSTGTP